jgi:hypothetical protein
MTSTGFPNVVTDLKLHNEMSEWEVRDVSVKNFDPG